MTRTPLRPLARILPARAAGENPDLIEAENLRARHQQMRDRDRQRAETRLQVLGLAFLAAFLVVGLRMGMLAASRPSEPAADMRAPPISASRADITDRNGRVLATNLVTNALYAQPPLMIDKESAARGLAGIFPDMNAEELLEKFNSKRKFIWLKRKISPEQQQQVHDLGEPGLLFGPREMRLYPNGRLAAHVLGGAGFGREGVRSAEIVGIAGVERWFDDELRDPARQGRPLQLSIDLSVQATIRRVLSGGMKLLNARSAWAVMMDAESGEVLALVSLPDFDPNRRPAPLRSGKAEDSPLFNRAVQGLYELGSVFKPLTAALALEQGIATPDSMVDIGTPLKFGKFTIRDFSDYGKALSVTDVIVKSSNIGSARLALQAGGGAQQAFLESLGLFAPTPLELPEARTTRPLLPKRWSEISTMTISYGHGISVTPLHLAAAYATLVNGGYRVVPTLLRKQDMPARGEQVIAPETSAALRRMLRQVVERGTATLGEVAGYQVGGKTGTAEKPKPGGGYYKEKIISSFAAVFPAEKPKYVLLVSLEEPVETSGPAPRRTAGWTAVPVSAEIIRRVAPLMGMRPVVDPDSGINYSLSNY